MQRRLVGSLRGVVGSVLRRGGVAPKTAPHGEGGSGAGATREVSREMEAYLGTEARLFGEPPTPAGGSRRVEAWEWTFWFVAASLAVGLWKYADSAKKADLFLWARDEAEERVRRRAQGKEVEFGMNYAALRAIQESRAGRERRTGGLSEAESVHYGPGEIEEE